jgi:4-hydroxy-3-polyprenylbenzoate decarboxylase
MKEPHHEMVEGDRGSARPVVVGISGASGSVLAKEAVEALLDREVPVALVCSNDARLVWQEEMDEPFGEVLARWTEHPHFTHHSFGDMRAPIASGTYPTRGMVVVPCSMASVAAMAHGLANNLLLRAADVCLKEGRRLVVVPRETPLYAVHLENLLALARMGVVVLPPEPPFYLRPRSAEEIVGFVVARILVALGIDDSLPRSYQYRGPGS